MGSHSGMFDQELSLLGGANCLQNFTIFVVVMQRVNITFYWWEVSFIVVGNFFSDRVP